MESKNTFTKIDVDKVQSLYNHISSKPEDIIGWLNDNSIPSGWKIGHTKDGRQRILCKDGSQHGSRREALKHMVIKGFPEEEIGILRSYLKSEGWEDNEKLRPKWKFKFKIDSQGKQRKFIMSRNGALFTTIVEAIRYMMSSTDYNQQ